MDPTENDRREIMREINTKSTSDDKEVERARLEKEYGQVWDTQQVRDEFEVIGFMAPFVVAKRKSDGKKGSMMFQHSPRFYFNWREDSY